MRSFTATAPRFTTRRQNRSPRRAQVAGFGNADRQRQPSPFHGEGNSRTAGSGRSHCSRTILDMVAGRVALPTGAMPFDFRALSAFPSPPAAPHIMQAWWHGIGSNALLTYPSKSILHPSSVTAKCRSTRRPALFLISQSGETADTLADAALCARTGNTFFASSMWPTSTYCPRERCGECRRLPARKLALPRPRRSRANRQRWRRLRSRRDARAACSPKTMRSGSCHALIEVPRHLTEALRS